MAAFRECFEDVEQCGCYFHFSQCFLRKLRKYPAVYEAYCEDPEYCFQLRHLLALAFLPPEDVTSCFELLMYEEFFARNEKELADFLVYFEKTWLGSISESVRGNQGESQLVASRKVLTAPFAFVHDSNDQSSVFSNQ